MSLDSDKQKIIVHLYDAPKIHGMAPEELMDEVYNSKKYVRWNTQDFTFLKKENPSVSKHNLECLSVEVTLNEILGPEKYAQIVKSLASCQPELSKTEAQTLHILIDLLKKKPDYLMSYLYGNGIFPGILFKNRGNFRPDVLDSMDNVLKQDPCWPLELALSCLRWTNRYPESLHTNLDQWVANHLKRVNLKKQVKDKDFVDDLICYTRFCSPNVHGVYPLICSQMDVFNEDIQHLLWDQILIHNTNEQRRQNAVSAFLNNYRSDAAGGIFYPHLCANVPQEELDKILWNGSDRIKSNYLGLLKNQGVDLTKVEIRNPETNEKKYLVWDLYSHNGITDAWLSELIQKYTPQQRGVPAKKSFLFHDKKLLNWDIFKAGCQKMKSSPMDVLRWISSFKKLPGFASAIASHWETLPPEVRQNNNIQLSMDNRFGLFYSLACCGNTAMLNEIKQTMSNNYPEFIRRLMRGSNKEGDNALHHLCRQHKKGIIKLLDKLPEAEQQKLLNQKNSLGESALDVCSPDFRRFLKQKNFIRPVVSEPLPQKKTVEAPVQVKPSEQPVQNAQPTQKMIWRRQFKATRFVDDCKKFENQPDVLKGARREIAKLRSMPWVDLQLRMGQEIKRSFKSRLCAAGFSANGNTYRMGYILQNGVIGVLFIMTHQQYNTELQTNGPLDTMAQNVRKQISAEVAQRKKDGRV